MYKRLYREYRKRKREATYGGGVKLALTQKENIYESNITFDALEINNHNEFIMANLFLFPCIVLLINLYQV